MKKYLKIILMLLPLMQLSFCVDEHVIEVNRNVNGSIFIDSNPDGAHIFLLGTDTELLTPDSIQNLESGLYEVTLKKENYQDTSFAVKVFKNLKTTKFIKLKPRKGNGKIIIKSFPSKAEIILNGETTDKFTPDSLENLRRGIYYIKLTLKDYKDTTFMVSLFSNDSRVSRTISLSKDVSTGNLFIDSDPTGAKIVLDTLTTNKTTPDTLKDISTGHHKVKLSLQDFSDTTFTVNVKKNETAKYKVELVDTTSPVYADVNYKVNFFTGQLKFLFTFNQDIALEKIEVIEPNSTITKVYPYNFQHYQEGEAAEINYAEKKTGVWRFNIFCKQLGGRQKNFKIIRSVIVQ